MSTPVQLPAGFEIEPQLPAGFEAEPAPTAAKPKPGLADALTLTSGPGFRHAQPATATLDLGAPPPKPPSIPEGLTPQDTRYTLKPKTPAPAKPSIEETNQELYGEHQLAPVGQRVNLAPPSGPKIKPEYEGSVGLVGTGAPGGMYVSGPAGEPVRVARTEEEIPEVTEESKRNLERGTGIEGYPKIAHGVSELAAGLDPDARTPAQRYKAGTETLEGAMEAATPLFMAAGATAPLKVATGLAAGLGSGYGAKKITEAAGGGPEAQEFAKTAGFVLPAAVAAAAGLRGSAVETPEVKAGMVSALGDRVAAGVVVTPEEVRIGGKLGGLKGSRSFSRGAPARPGLEAPTLEGEPPSSQGAPSAPPPPRPTPPEVAEAVRSTIAHTANEQMSIRAAQGLPPVPPPPVAQPPKYPPVNDRNLAAIGQIITRLPQDQREAGIVEAHDHLAPALAQQKKVFVGGKLHIINSPEEASKVAQQLINDQVAAADKAATSAPQTVQNAPKPAGQHAAASAAVPPAAARPEATGAQRGVRNEAAGTVLNRRQEPDLRAQVGDIDSGLAEAKRMLREPDTTPEERGILERRVEDLTDKRAQAIAQAKAAGDYAERQPSEAVTLPRGFVLEGRATATPNRVRMPGTVGRIPTQDVHLDPARFQYKLLTDAQGVSTLLKEQDKFKPELASVISVWHDPADGKTYVVNGHHRLELARRTGHRDVNVFHIEAANEKQARATGALQNIAEGRGTPVDAAKFFRDSSMTAEELKGSGVSMGEATARDGLALSKLDGPLFDRVVAGDLRVGRAVAVGAATSDPAEQKAILDLVDRRERGGGRVSDETLAELARMVQNSGKTTETTASLFGEQEITRSLALEKAELSAYVRQQLARDKRLFGYIADKGRATQIEGREAGKIDVERSRAISSEAQQAEEVYNKLSSRAGPVADALEAGARRLAEGENQNGVKQETYAAARQAVSEALRGGQAGGAGERPADAADPDGEADKPKGPLNLLHPAPSPVFYSKALQVAEAKLPNSGLALAALRTLENNGVKPDEIKWIGLDDFLKGKGKVTKAEVLAFMRENQAVLLDVVLGGRKELVDRASAIAQKHGQSVNVLDDIDRVARYASSGYTPEEIQELRAIKAELDLAGPTQYETYQLPGGENYRESFLIAPSKAVPEGTAIDLGRIRGELDALLKKDDLGGYDTTLEARVGVLNAIEGREHNEWSPETLAKAREYAALKAGFASGKHWSDGHPAYNGIGNPVIRVRHNERMDADGKRILFIEEMQPPSKSQPMPEELRTRAYELGMKRMIRLAAEKGFDKLAWTTGEQQAERYDLSKHVDSIKWIESKDGTGILAADKGDSTVIDKQISRDELADYIGKDAAAKLLAQEPRPYTNSTTHSVREISGLDLKVGGAGLKRAYDQMLPAIASKLGKKWGAKVGETDLDVPRAMGRDVAYEVRDGRGGMHAFGDEVRARGYAEQVGGEYLGPSYKKATVPSIPITPAMKQSVVHEGQPLFRPEDADRQKQQAAAAELAVVHDARSEVRSPDGLHPYLLVNDSALSLIKLAFGRGGFDAINMDPAEPARVADGIEQMASRFTDDIAQRRLANLADALRQASGPEHGAVIVPMMPDGSPHPGYLLEEMIHAIQRKAGEGDYSRALDTEALLSHPEAAPYADAADRIRRAHGHTPSRDELAAEVFSDAMTATPTLAEHAAQIMADTVGTAPLESLLRIAEHVRTLPSGEAVYARFQRSAIEAVIARGGRRTPRAAGERVPSQGEPGSLTGGQPAADEGGGRLRGTRPVRETPPGRDAGGGIVEPAEGEVGGVNSLLQHRGAGGGGGIRGVNAPALPLPGNAGEPDLRFGRSAGAVPSDREVAAGDGRTERSGDREDAGAGSRSLTAAHGEGLSADELQRFVASAGRHLQVVPAGEQGDLFGGAEKVYKLLNQRSGESTLVTESGLDRLRLSAPDRAAAALNQSSLFHPAKDKAAARSKEAGFVKLDFLLGKPTSISMLQGAGKWYGEAVDKVLQGIHMGRAYPEVDRHDRALGDRLRELRVAPAYLRAKAEAIEKKVVGDLTRAQEKGLVLLADKASADWLNENRHDEWLRYQDDPVVQSALERYRPHEAELRDAQRSLGGPVIEDDYLRRVYDAHVAGVRRKVTPENVSVGDTVQAHDRGTLGSVVSVNRQTGEVTVSFRNPESKAETVKDFSRKQMESGALTFRGRTTGAEYPSYDRVITPQTANKQGRQATPEYYYQHGLHEFGPSFVTRYISTNLKLLEHSIAAEFMSKATKTEGGDTLPAFIDYGGKRFYSPEAIRLVKLSRSSPAEGKALAKELGVEQLPKPWEVRPYAVYTPYTGDLLAGGARGLAKNAITQTGAAEPDLSSLQGQAHNLLGKMAVRYLGPKDVVDAMSSEARDAVPGFVRAHQKLMGPIVGGIRQQLLITGIPHIKNILRRVMQQRSLAQLDPRAWRDAWQVMFDKELKAQALKGVDDPDFDALLRHGGISVEGAITYEHYLHFNFDEGSWKNLWGTTDALKEAFSEPGVSGKALGASRIAGEIIRSVPTSKVGQYWHKKLFGAGGMDPRARLLIAKMIKEQDPKITNAEIAERLNDQLGRYAKGTWTDFQRAMAPYMMFPGWNYSSANWVLKHPFRSVLPWALLVLLANNILYHYGKNRDRDRYDWRRFHVGGRGFGDSLGREHLAAANPMLQVPLDYAKARAMGHPSGHALGEALGGLQGDASVLMGEANPLVSIVPEFAFNRQSMFNRDEPIIQKKDWGRAGKVVPRPLGGKGAEELAGYGAKKLFPQTEAARPDAGATDWMSLIGRNVGTPNFPDKRKRSASSSGFSLGSMDVSPAAIDGTTTSPQAAPQMTLPEGFEPEVVPPGGFEHPEPTDTKPPEEPKPEDISEIGKRDKESGRLVVQPSESPTQAQRLATAAAPELEQRLKAIVASVPGADFRRIRPQKSKGRVGEKTEDRPAETVGDYLGAQVAVDSVRAKAQVLAALKKEFDVLEVEDRFLRPDSGHGYPSANVQVKLSNDSSAEVQLVPREVMDVNDASHRYYEAGRDAEVEGDNAERDRQWAKARQMNLTALDQFRRRNTQKGDEVGLSDGARGTIAYVHPGMDIARVRTPKGTRTVNLRDILNG